MGSPKHLLPLIGSEPIYATLLRRCHGLCSSNDFYLSLKSPEQASDLVHPVSGIGLKFVFDSDLLIDDKVTSDIGPAAGLLAAYQALPSATWLVLACDYPLISSVEIQRLIESYQPPITCFRNVSDWPEPLLGIWSPAALQRLLANVKNNILGPIKVVRALQGKTIEAADERSLFNANAPEEWENAVQMMKTIHS